MSVETIGFLIITIAFSHVWLGMIFASNLFEDNYQTNKLINKIILTILTILFLPEVIFIGVLLLLFLFLTACYDLLKK